MTTLDIRTLSLVATLTSLLLALGLVLVNRVIAKDPSLRLWGMGVCANGVGFILLALRGALPDLVSIVVANTVLLVGTVWMYMGIRHYQGLGKSVRWCWVLVGMTAVLLTAFTYISPHLSVRIAIYSAASAPILFSCGYVLVSAGSAESRIVRWFVSGAFFVSAVFMAVRSAVVGFSALPGQDFMLAAYPIYSWALLLGICMCVVLGIGFPLLVTVRMHKQLRDSESRYRLLYTRTPAIMHSITADGTVVSVSDLWLQTFGYRRDEVLGHKVFEFMTESSSQYAREKALPVFFQTGTTFNVPYQYIARDGRILDMRLSAIRETDAGPGGDRGLAVMEDVTERNQIEAARSLSELQFRGAFESAAHGMALVSIEGRFLKVNAALCAMVGYSEPELLAIDFQRITHPDDLAADEALVQKLLNREVTDYQMEKRYVHKTGRLIWIQLSVSLVRSKDGDPVHFVVQVQDITRSKSESLRLQTLLDTASDGIHVLDEEGHVVQFSPSFARMLGYTNAEMAQINVRDWEAQLAEHEVTPKYHALIKEPMVFETLHRRKDGSIIEVEINARGIELDGRTYLYASARDVTEHKRDQRRVEQLLAEQKAMLENELIGIARVRDRAFTWVNPAFNMMLGYAPGELVGKPTRLIYHTEDAYLDFGAKSYPVIAQGSIYRTQIEMVRKDGRSIWVDISGSVLDDGDAGESLWGFVDVTERRQYERAIKQSEERMELALDAADLGLWDLDVVSARVVHNPRLLTMIGYGRDELELNVSTLQLLIHPQDLPHFQEAFRAALAGEAQGLNCEVRLHHSDGHWLWVRCRGKVVEWGGNGRAIRMAGTTADISARKANEEKINELAFFDPLTHLPNRRLLMDRLGKALPASARQDTFGAVLFLDLDNFKALNDTKGHDFGDLLLIEVARRLLSCVRVEDTVARLGGDEFVVMLGSLSADAQLAAAEAQAIGTKILETVAVDYALPQYRHYCSCSIGIALFKGTDVDSMEIIKRADIAMYQAKAAGRNTLRLFLPDA